MNDRVISWPSADFTDTDTRYSNPADPAASHTVTRVWFSPFVGAPIAGVPVTTQSAACPSLRCTDVAGVNVDQECHAVRIAERAPVKSHVTVDSSVGDFGLLMRLTELGSMPGGADPTTQMSGILCIPPNNFFPLDEPDGGKPQVGGGRSQRLYRDERGGISEHGASASSRQHHERATPSHCPGNYCHPARPR